MMPSRQEMERAALLLRNGGLVAFPTETVYGLGANALDAAAVARIYAVKGRPATSPLIVHVASHEMARGLVKEWPEQAETLASRFWPGALTLVLPKSELIPDIVTAGLPTVGVRMPSHLVALALLQEAGVPLAAPSANRFTELSPTKAEHVRRSLGDAVDMVLDGGGCEVGIESTVLTLGERPVLLRPGMVSREQLEEVIGPVDLHQPAEGAHPSPGLHPRHYSPRTRLVVLRRGEAAPPGRGIVVDWLPGEPHAYAAELYGCLHRLDVEGHDWIAIPEPPDEPAWAAIRDRLQRAAHR